MRTQLVLTLTVALFSICDCGKKTIIAAPPKNLEGSYQVTLVSQWDTDAAGKKLHAEGETVLCYTWTQEGADRLLRFDSKSSKMSVNGLEITNLFRSLNKVVIVQQGQKQVLNIATAPESIRTQLKNMFGGPVCRVQVDELGTVVKRGLLNDEMGKPLVSDDLVQTALLFHAPIPLAAETWDANTELCEVGDNVVKGKLTYKRLSPVKGNSEVSVEGKILNETVKQIGAQKASVKSDGMVTGKQLFDLVQRAWLSGELEILNTVSTSANGKVLELTKNKTKATLATVPTKK